MAANSSQVSSVTEPDLKKPKLDHGDNDEAETMETLESVKPWMSTESDDDFTESEFEAIYAANRLGPQDFEFGELVELCKSALAHYQVEHPGESYEFESGQGGRRWFKFRSMEYYFEFCAKNLNLEGNPVRNFEASVFYHPFDGPEEFVVQDCLLLKDDELEPKFPMDHRDEHPLEDIEEEEYVNIVEFCKSALAFYKENNARESYEFVRMQKVKRWILNGVEYILVFLAVNEADGNTLATFKASVYNLKRAVEIMSCELAEIVC